MRQYFKHFLKKNIGFLLFLTLFCMIVYIAPLLTQDYYRWNDSLDRYSPNVYLANISVALCLMAVFIPIILFSYKMNKRSVDMYYSLPLSKRKILLVHFLVGLILLYVPYTVTFFTGLIVTAVKLEGIEIIYFLYLYLSTLIPAFTAYSVTAFIFTRANTVWDGMIAVAGALCLFALVVGAIREIFDLSYRVLSPSAFYPFSAINTATEKFEGALFRKELNLRFPNTLPLSQYLLPGDEDISLFIGGSIWTLIGVATTVALFALEPRSRAENCGQISDGPFSCKILLPIYAFLFPIVIANYLDDLFILFIVAFAVYVLAVVYKRRFWIGWKYAVLLLCCLIAGMILGFI